MSTKTVEKIQVHVFEKNEAAAARVAGVVAGAIRERAAQGKGIVLGLPTGHTPIGVYRELIRLHQTGQLDLSGVVTFNLDEYYPMAPESLQSYHRWMQE